MGQVVPITSASRQPVCPRCGAEVEHPSFGVASPCGVCSFDPEAIRAPLPGAGRPKREVRKPEPKGTSVDHRTPERDLSTSVVEDVRRVDKRVDSLLAFVPLYGPIRIRRSELHTLAERRKLARMSIGLTVIVALALLLQIPSAADHQAELQARMGREIQVLNDVALEYREQHGRYPTPETWQRLAERADPRFFDPWGRPYRYEADEVKGLTIGTYGRDGVERGSGEDADLWLRFEPAGEAG